MGSRVTQLGAIAPDGTSASLMLVVLILVAQERSVYSEPKSALPR